MATSHRDAEGARTSTGLRGEACERCTDHAGTEHPFPSEHERGVKTAPKITDSIATFQWRHRIPDMTKASRYMLGNASSITLMLRWQAAAFRARSSWRPTKAR